MPKDYYNTLGVERNASADEIKKAFRSLAHKYHPDKGGDEAKFKEVNEAYQVLGDEGKRAQYDRFGSAAFENGGFGAGGGQGPFGGFSGFGGQGIDIEDLGDLFGNVFGFGGGGRGRARRGADIEMDLQLSFEEAARGGEQAFSIYKTVRCAKCGGSGGEPGAEVSTCKTCGGKGKVAGVQRTVFGSIRIEQPCGDCGGRGKAFAKKCSECRGAGVRKENRDVKVGVPAGIADGETLRIAGEGEAGAEGVPPGDLYLHVRVRPDRRWTRSGNDLVTRREIGFTLAALGGSIEVDSLEGPVKLEVPAGIQSGQVLRVRGRGLTSPRSSNRGDLLVEIVVMTPKKLSREQRNLLEELDLK